MDAALKERLDAIGAGDLLRIAETLWDALERIKANDAGPGFYIAKGALKEAQDHLEVCEEIERAPDPPLH